MCILTWLLFKNTILTTPSPRYKYSFNVALQHLIGLITNQYHTNPGVKKNPFIFENDKQDYFIKHVGRDKVRMSKTTAGRASNSEQDSGPFSAPRLK